MPTTRLGFRSGRSTRRPQLSSALEQIVRLLENPYVGALLGLLLAYGLLFASRSSFRRIEPDTAPIGLAIAAVSLFARLAGVTAVLWAYKTYLNPGFKPFALALAGGFFVLYTVELVRYTGALKKRPSVGARQ